MARFSRRWLLVAAGLWTAACLSPTLPLPPPSRPDIEGPDAQGNVTLRGNVQGGAWVVATNKRLGEGDASRAAQRTGEYVLVVPAVVGDELTLWYRVGIDDSPSIVFLVPKPKLAQGADAGAAGASGAGGAGGAGGVSGAGGASASDAGTD